MATIDLFPKQKRILTPEEYLRLSSDEKANISRSMILPASLDNDNFGKIVIKLKTPEYGSHYGK